MQALLQTTAAAGLFFCCVAAPAPYTFVSGVSLGATSWILTCIVLYLDRDKSQKQAQRVTPTLTCFLPVHFPPCQLYVMHPLTGSF